MLRLNHRVGRAVRVVAVFAFAGVVLPQADAASPGLLSVKRWAADSASRISAPPPLRRPMTWAASSGLRRAADASTFGNVAVIGLDDLQNVTRLPRGLRIMATLPDIKAVEVVGSARLLTSVRSSRRSWIRYVEAPQPMRNLDAPNDPLTTQLDPALGLPYEWNFSHIAADQALSLATGDPSIVVGYVDSGISDVPDLTGQIAQTMYFPSDASDATDTAGHGTFVASIIASRPNDGFGLSGFCGLCRLMSFKVATLTSVQVSAAITQLVDKHVRVINLSIGSRSPNSLIQDAVNYAINAGVLIVASSGNDGASSVSYPAALLQPTPGQLGYGLAVGASNVADGRASFSNWGDSLSIEAPGAYDGRCSFGVLGALPPVATEFQSPGTCSRVFSDRSGNLYAYAAGTSFSAPEVAGIAALVWSVNPALKNYQVVDILEQTANRPAGTGWASDRGWGVLNAAAAVAQARSTVNPPSDGSGSSGSGGSPPGGSSASSTKPLFLSPLILRGSLGPGTVVIAATRASGTFASLRCTVTVGDSIVMTIVRSTQQESQCAWKIPFGSGGTRGAVSLSATRSSGEKATRSKWFQVRGRAARDR